MIMNFIADGRPIELVMRNELAIQHMLPPRQFLCLTSSGLHLIMKYRPVDILREVLGGSRGADTPDIRVRTRHNILFFIC